METSKQGTEAIEEQCLEIYGKILEYPDIAVTDDFLDIGGDSVKAVLIVVELEKLFGIEIPMATFFENRVISEMIDHISTHDESTG